MNLTPRSSIPARYAYTVETRTAHAINWAEALSTNDLDTAMSQATYYAEKLGHAVRVIDNNA